MMLKLFVQEKQDRAETRVVIWDPELVKEVFSDKSGQFKKPPVNPLIQILTSLKDEEWA